jgi:hypothetical protein
MNNAMRDMMLSPSGEKYTANAGASVFAAGRKIQRHYGGGLQLGVMKIIGSRKNIEFLQGWTMDEIERATSNVERGIPRADEAKDPPIK